MSRRGSLSALAGKPSIVMSTTIGPCTAAVPSFEVGVTGAVLAVFALCVPTLAQPANAATINVKAPTFRVTSHKNFAQENENEE
jgi:hypothetical protein